MTGEIGQLALCLALALALVQAGAGLWGARAATSTSLDLPRQVARMSAFGFFAFIALAFGALTFGFVTSDFSILLVAQNSHTLKPLIYKISGVWGNHEGSMLLWVLVLAIYSAVMALAVLPKRCAHAGAAGSSSSAPARAMEALTASRSIRP